jgi:peptidoglycan/xylan/chitin deacetylase (PgdA/CDA1 family)
MNSVRRFVIVISIVFIVFLILAVGEEIDVSVEIATWKNNASGAVTLSFDDGYLETYKSVIPPLDNRSVRGTFNIITSRVGGRYGELELADWQHWRDARDSRP